ncbi:MAG: hypothetical protein KBS80_07045 [Bacteroidales bacterium]|nr:hypothetical protein [Candidatus Cryptobacteroides choladohippi]
MNYETLNLIFAAAALFIALMTFIVTVATLIFTVKNSKGYIYKEIDKKTEQIRQIEHNEVLKYGLNGRFPRVITPEDEKKERLQNEISELERKL